MAGIDWFRWHHGSVTDPKFQLVARKSGSSVAEVIGVWATLLEAASMSGVRGCHGDLDFEALDCALGLDDGKAEQIYSLMTARGLVDAETKSIHSWAKRQPSRERDDDKSSERVKAFREKKHQETPCNASETPCNATKRHETPRGEESREEKSREESEDTHTVGTPAPALPTKAGAVCVVIKAEGVHSVNPNHPDLLALIDAGAGVGHFAEAARMAAQKKKGFAYVLGIVRGQLADAQALADSVQAGGGLPGVGKAQPESFRARDDRVARERWEQMTGQTHPDSPPKQPSNVIDITPQILEISQ